MKKWRRESVLDLYNLLLAMFLLVSPWLFARTDGTAAIDLRASGAALAMLSLAAIVAFASWEEWVNLALGLLLAGKMLFRSRRKRGADTDEALMERRSAAR